MGEKMDLKDWLFWNVDTQIDFVYPRGKLYVQGAEELRPQWKELTMLAKEKVIRVINTADYHYANSAELDASPDFINTFPEHCMAHSRGADYIRETEPEDPVVFDWDKEYLITPELFEEGKHRNFVIRKDAFDVFSGNPLTDTILKQLKPTTVVVYGVTTNVCVDAAVKGLSKKVKNVYVIKDAIKELPNIPLPFENWEKKGVEMITLKELKKMLSKN
ncbi:isochorismatase family protein [Mariniphaga sediminis]|jgi:nicotinamidase/pyrazinamidase|uniref:nicotinamidase n=2 Tax=Mariniphaga sediminis TaxID=1628158 RepID=A0A399D1W7_9BACT|nr:isochorismatase family protein [Mariniphaga sediminis]